MVRLMKRQDIPFFNGVRNECSKFLHDNSTHTLSEAKKWFIAKGDKDPFFIYELGGELIGYFRTSNWGDDNCYIGMDMHKDYRGKKLAIDAYHEFMQYLTENYNIMIFKLEVLRYTNYRAYNLYKKLGFKEIDRETFTDHYSLALGELWTDINITMELNTYTEIYNNYG